MPQLDIKWVEDFLALAHSGSFGRAARQRHVTQPAFSRRIQSLEHWLGTELIDRSTLPVRLTEAGEAFLEDARRIVGIARTARHDLRSRVSAERARVRIITLHTLAAYVVPTLVSPYLAARPEASVEILPSVQGIEAYFEALESDFGDVVVAYAHHRTPGPRDRFDSRRIRLDRMVPVAHPEVARLAAGSGALLPLLAYTPTSVSHELVQPVLAGLGLAFRVVGVSALAESLRALALGGLGLAWLPETVAADALADGRLVRMWPGEERVEIALDIRCWSRRETPPGPLRSFLETLPQPG